MVGKLSCVWSSWQEAVIRDVAEGKGHTVVLARAGSGKTTTIMAALEAVPPRRTIMLAAFSKAIANELVKRVPQGKGIEVKTLHAHGYAACKRAFRSDLDDDKTIRICEMLFGDRHQAGFSYAAMKKLCSTAKDTLVDAADLNGLDQLIDAFDIDAPEGEFVRADFVAKASQVLAKSKELTTTVDFADMCWLPVVLGLNVWQFDRVFVDETQDLSPSQIELLLKCCKPSGRICAVGDDRQAIFGFRGADENAVPNLIDRLQAKVLPLSITYRCAKKIVELAQRVVPDLQAAPDAVDGEINHVFVENMKADASYGDFIISRTNAPLIGLALGFLKDGKRVAIMGRDIGEGLARLVRKSNAQSVEAFEEWVNEWERKEVARLLKKDRPTEEATDKAACLYALAEGASSIGEILTRAESLFTRVEDGQRITLGTTHRLKGLEAHRVWMLADTYRSSRGTEEANLWYVAVTRAKHTLCLVRENPANV